MLIRPAVVAVSVVVFTTPMPTPAEAVTLTNNCLLAPAAIEYAAQAMALHGGLCAPAGSAPTAGFLAAVRSVRLHVPRLDDIPGPLAVSAQLLAGDARQALYSFSLHSAAGALLVQGRATVILNARP